MKGGRVFYGGHGNDGRACVAAHYTSNTNNASSPMATGHRPWPLDLPTALYHHNMVVAPSISICYDSSSPNPCLIKFLVRRAQGRNAILRRHCKVVWQVDKLLSVMVVWQIIKDGLTFFNSNVVCISFFSFVYICRTATTTKTICRNVPIFSETGQKFTRCYK